MSQTLMKHRSISDTTGEPDVKGDARATPATRIVVSAFGVLAALAGIEHGVGEVLQGSVSPRGLAIESSPHSEAFEVLSGEPAMTVIPNLLLTGILAVILALGVGIWAVGFVDRRRGGLALILLSVLLLLLGGGFGPPLVGIIIGIGATRIGAVSRRRPGGVSRALGRVWAWLLGAGVLGFLSLLPGAVLLSQLLGVENPSLVYGLSAFSFAGLILALVAARAQDRVRAIQIDRQKTSHPQWAETTRRGRSDRMPTARETSRFGGRGSRVRRRFPFWLWLSLPIAVLAVTGSIIGIVLEERIYGAETPNWAAQSVGQDIANLVAYPLLVLLALLAGRGSLRAYLTWTGVLAYSAYTYTIYAFDIHFGPLFLVWVAVLGLSIYVLIGSLSSIDPGRVMDSFTDKTPVRSTSALLIGVGVVFSLLWLSEIVPAMLEGTTPEVVAEAGLPTNPVHVLDLAVFLPAAVLAGAFLARRRAWGYVLAPTVLVAMVVLAAGIVSLMAVLAARGETTSIGVGIGIGALAVVELVVVVRFLRAIDRRAGLADVLRPAGGFA
jgi:hypothetical protein